MKRPSLQFYVGDWQSNTNLRRCTFAEKGIWLEVMCLMHDAEQYGVLRWPLKEIAQAVGCKVSDLLSLRTKGVLKGADAGQKCSAHVYTPRHAGKDGDPVTLIPEQDGPIWFSSRMANDEYVRNSRGKGTRFGDQKPQQKEGYGSAPTHRLGERQDDDSYRRQGDGPSTSSSTSESKKEKMDRAELTETAQRDPTLLVIRIFDDARAEVFGATSQREFPAGDDRVFAERFLAAGAPLDWLKAFFLERMAKRKAANEDAPASLRYFQKAVPEALKRIADARSTSQVPIIQPKPERVERTREEQEKYDAEQRQWHLRMGIQHRNYNPEGLRSEEVA